MREHLELLIVALSSARPRRRSVRRALRPRQARSTYVAMRHDTGVIRVAH